MANAIPSRAGQINSTGDDRALFLKKFSGLILTAFREKTKFLSRHIVQTIDSGKAAQFPATGKATASYHVPGTELLGQKINHAERVITIDDLLVADAFIPEIDLAMSHYEYRREYAYQLGAALARAFDKNVARVMLQAARSSATVAGGNGGTTITEPNAKTDAQALVDAIFAAAQALDEKDVPEEDRYCFVRPAEYNLLVNSDIKAINRDFGGKGSVADGVIVDVAGIPIVKTNNLPNTDETADDSVRAEYRGDWSGVAALVAHRSAAGTVKLLDLSTRVDYDPRRLGWLAVAKYAIGHGILRPESAVEIVTA